MKQAWDDVQKLIDEMRPLLLQAGIPERQTKMPEAEPEEIKSERYVEIYDWLHALKLSSEWDTVKKARGLVKEYVWVNYKATGVQGLQEQIILENANIKLRKIWKRNRPFFFGRKFKKPNTENPDGETSETETDASLKDSDTQDSV